MSVVEYLFQVVLPLFLIIFYIIPSLYATYHNQHISKFNVSTLLIVSALCLVGNIVVFLRG